MFHPARKSLAAAITLALGLLSPLSGNSADAAGAASNEVKNAQQKCDGVGQDRAACLREAGAAAQERRSDGLTDPAQKQQQQNASARCADQPAAARADCESRMGGAANSKSEGRVSGGGIIRETVTPAPAAR